MGVKWIKDVDSGELFPVPDEEPELESLSHLQIGEHTVVDYDKTYENTITGLQEQLIAAQNQIEVYKNTQIAELSNNIPKEVQQNHTLNDKPKRFTIDKSLILLATLCIVCLSTAFLGLKYFSDNGYLVEAGSSEQAITYQEADDDKPEESEEYDFLDYLMDLKYFAAPFLAIGGVRLGIHFFRLVSHDV